ncbi:cation:proton antiporter subunit C [Candidatus Calescamantes bacterium]|nr:cation:proton antiporter subunit C [Candidatus Calescamantes bacterium]MCK5600029.1 cation:proton antiporter subunit C [bacterium]
MIYILCLILFFIGLYGIFCKKNLIKIVLGFIIMENAVNLFLILLGYKNNGIAPIMTKSMRLDEFLASSVDPLPQALVLTSIVIGLAVTALMVAVAIRIYERFGTFDITEIKRLKG